MTIVNGWKPLIIFTKSPILDMVASENCNILAHIRDRSIFQVTPSKFRSIFFQKFQLAILGAGEILKRISNDGFIFRRKRHSSGYMVIKGTGELFK